MRAATMYIIHEAWRILDSHNPMTLRQVFYRLVAAQHIENTQAKYKSLGRALVIARQEGTIPWDWIEDRLRMPRHIAMWENVSDFSTEALEWYKRDVWQDQPSYVECWLEKDALSGIFERSLHDYGVTLNVGRGYDSWSAIYLASNRLMDGDTVLYFGDFDPSGEDMVRSLQDRLEFFSCRPTIEKVALTMEDIEKYELPPNPAKLTDTRSPGFIARHGDNCVELDALPPDRLAKIIEEAILNVMDFSDLEITKQRQREDVKALEGFFANV